MFSKSSQFWNLFDKISDKVFKITFLRDVIRATVLFNIEILFILNFVSHYTPHYNFKMEDTISEAHYFRL